MELGGGEGMGGSPRGGDDMPLLGGGPGGGGATPGGLLCGGMVTVLKFMFETVNDRRRF